MRLAGRVAVAGGRRRGVGVGGGPGVFAVQVSRTGAFAHAGGVDVDLVVGDVVAPIVVGHDLLLVAVVAAVGY